MKRINVETAQDLILQNAADIANHKYRGPASGKIFRPDPVQSRLGGLCLSISDAVDMSLTDEQRAELWNIGANAIEESIMEYQDLFISMIFTDAYDGKNYFDRFKIDG